MSKPISIVVVVVVIVVVQKKLGPKMGSILGSMLGFNIGLNIWLNIWFNIGFEWYKQLPDHFLKMCKKGETNIYRDEIYFSEIRWSWLTTRHSFIYQLKMINKHIWEN